MNGAQLVVKHEDIRLDSGCGERELLRLAGADIGSRIHGTPALLLFGNHLDPRRLAKLRKLGKRIVAVRTLNPREYRAIRLDLYDVIGVG